MRISLIRRIALCLRGQRVCRQNTDSGDSRQATTHRCAVIDMNAPALWVFVSVRACGSRKGTGYAALAM